MRMIETISRNSAFDGLKVVKFPQQSKTSTVNRDLYLECVAQLIDDEAVTFHVVMMPEVEGGNFYYCAKDESDFVQHVADQLQVEIRENDAIIVLGKDFLNADLSEDRMMEYVLADVAMHIGRLCPIADPTIGWVGQHIGWSAIAATMFAGHGIMQMLDHVEVLKDRIKDAGQGSIARNLRVRTSRLDAYQHRQAFQAIEDIVEVTCENKGGYIMLPTTVEDIASVAKGFLHEVVDAMVIQPRLVA